MTAVDHKQREELIAQYRDGYRTVAEALLKITDEELSWIVDRVALLRDDVRRVCEARLSA